MGEWEEGPRLVAENDPVLVDDGKLVFLEDAVSKKEHGNFNVAGKSPGKVNFR